MLTVRKAETVCPACRRTFRNGDGPVTFTASPKVAAVDQAMTSMIASVSSGAAWAALRAGLTDEDIATAHEMRRGLRARLRPYRHQQLVGLFFGQ